MSIKGRLNFYQFGSFGKFSEQRYRQQFEKSFNFPSFNKKLIKTYCSNKVAIAAVDIENNTAMHINAAQTSTQKELKNKKMSLLD